MNRNELPLISVIIPVFNVEKYIERCLTSVVNQTYDNLEIIIVDDGSQDKSMQIVANYQSDKRLKVIHQQNHGLSSARNTGIKYSTGEYLTFIDSDDFVTKDYVQYLYDLLARNKFKSKLSLCSLMDIFTKNNKQRNMGNGKVRTISGKNCIKMMCYHDLVDTCAYAKLGHRSLYDDHFFPDGNLFEDIGSTYKLFEQCPTVECGFEAKYYYAIRDDSIVTSGFKLNKLDLLEMTDQMSKSVNKHYPDLQSATLRRQVYARFSTLNQTLGENNLQKIQLQLVDFIKKNKQAVLSDPLTPNRDRLAYRLLSFGLPVYSLAWRMYLKFSK